MFIRPSKAKQKIKINSHMLVGCLTDDISRRMLLMIPINVGRGSSRRLNWMKITIFAFDQESSRSSY